jgi:hypothetical protein
MKEIEQGQGKKEVLDTAAETTKAAYDEAKEKYEEAAKLERELNIKLAELAEDLAAQQARNVALESLHNQGAETKAHSELLKEQMEKDAARQEQEKNAGAIKNDFLQTPSGQVDQAVIAADVAMQNAQRGLDPTGQGKAAAIAKLIDLVEHLAGKTEAQDAELHQRINQLEGILAARGPRS